MLTIALSMALLAAMPALANAQSLSPTDEQYECGVLGITGGGGGEECGPKEASASGGPSDDSNSTPAGPAGDSAGPGEDTLPFTGLDLWLVAAIGTALLAGGLALRRVAGSDAS